MLALGIDTSTPMVSVAVARADSVVLARRDGLVHNGHGEALAGFIDAVFHDAGCRASDLTAVGVGLGPGPFTGLRVGIVTAAALSDALGIPAYGVCSLDTIRYAGEPYAVVTDARRRQVYWAVYDEKGVRADGPEINTPMDLVEHLHGRVGRIVGPVAADNADAFAAFAVSEPRWPDAGAIAVHAAEQAIRSASPDPLTPLYLRRPDAREPGAPKRVTPA